MATYLTRTIFFVFVYISVTASKLVTSSNGHLRVPVRYTSTNVVFDPASVTNSTVLQAKAKMGHSKVQIENVHMMGTIKLGKQPFNVMFDSGSSALWVFGKDVNRDYFAEDKRPFNHRFYDEKKSGTFRPHSSNPEATELCASEHYLDGCSTEGTVGFEEFTVGDIVVPHTRFQITKKLMGPKNQFTLYDGICGLGLSPRVSGKVKLVSPFVKMVETGALGLQMFSVFIGKEGSEEGEIIFGGYDTKRFNNNPIEMTNVIPHPTKGEFSGWIVRVSMIRLGALSMSLPFHAFLDTGSNAIMLPGLLLDTMPDNQPSVWPLLAALDDIEHGEYAYVQCTDRHTFPTLTFGIGTRMYTLDWEDYTAAPGGTFSFVRKEIEYCALLVGLDRHNSDDEFTLGAPFLRKYYTMFYYDYEESGQPMIGLAEAKHDVARDAQHQPHEEGYIPPSYSCGAWCGFGFPLSE